MRITLVLFMLPFLCLGQGKISELPAVSSLTGSELVEVVQSGTSKKANVNLFGSSFYAPLTRTITINGTTYDLSANRSWSVGNVFTSGTYSNPSWITSLNAGKITGTVSILQGGTGQTTANAALNALLPSQATHAGKVLQTDGTNTSWQLSGSITGTGTADQLTKWTGTSSIGNATTGIDVLTALAANVGDLGSFVVNGGETKSLVFTGTGGNGYLNLNFQSTPPSFPANGVRLFADNNNQLAWKSTAGLGFISIVNSSITADRTYTLPDLSGTFVLGSGTSGQITTWNGTNSVNGVTPGTGVLTALGVNVGSTGSFNPMTSLGDIIYGGASGTATRLAGNITTKRKYLSQTGNGSVSAAPSYYQGYDVYNVMDYGAVGDGVTDDTDEIIAALAAIPTKGGTLYLPPGDYLVSAQIVVNKNVIITGSGYGPYNFFDAITDVTGTPGATNIICASTIIDLFLLTNTGSETHPIRTFKDLSIINTSTTPTAGSGIKLVNKAANTLIENVLVKGFYNNINITGGLFTTIKHCRVIDPKHDAIVLDNTLSPDNGGYTVEDTYIFASRTTGRNPRYGIYHTGAGVLYVSNCNINSGLNYSIGTPDATQNFQYAIYSDYSGGASSDILITNTAIENYWESGIRINNISGSQISHVHINNCTISPYFTPATNVRQAIVVANVDRLIINGITGNNTTNVSGYSFISLTNVNNATIAGITFDNYGSLLTKTSCTNVAVFTNRLSEMQYIQNGFTNLSMSNASTGTSATVGLRTSLVTDFASNTFNWFMFGTNAATSGLTGAKVGVAELNTGSHFLISNYAASDLVFATNTRTERLRIGSTGSITTGSSTSPVYRTTNGGSDVSAHMMIDPANSLTSGNAWGYSTADGLVATLANGTRRIAGAALKLVNTTTTAGSEVASIGLFTKASGGAMAERFRFGSDGGFNLNGAINIGTIGSGSAGSSGQVLTSAGSGAPPTWSTISAIGGSTGATDNAVLRADGTGGATLQNSGISIADGGTLFWPAGGGTIQAGNGSGPTITFTSSALTTLADANKMSSAVAAGNVIEVFTSTTNAIQDVLQVQAVSTGTAAAGHGAKISLSAESGGGAYADGTTLTSIITDATNAAEDFTTRIQTMTNGAEVDRVSILGKKVTLTESSATQFAQITIASGTICGGEVEVTVEANDATDYQARTLRAIFTAVNKAGTLTMTLETPTEVVAVSTGTLTVTLTTVDGGSGVMQFKANATSSLTQTTLRANSVIIKNFGGAVAN